MRQHMTMQEIRAEKKSAQERLRRLTAESIIERAGADMYAVRPYFDHVTAHSANQLAIGAVLRYARIGFIQHAAAFPQDGGRPYIVPFITYGYDGKRDLAILLHSERWDKGEEMEKRKLATIEASFPGVRIVTLEDEELRNDPHTAFLRLGLDMSVDVLPPFEIGRRPRCYDCGIEGGRGDGLRPLKEWAEFYHMDLPAYDGPDASDFSTVRLYCADCALKTLTQYQQDRHTLIACGALIALYEARDILKSAGYVFRGDAFDRMYDVCKSGTLEVRSKAEMCVALMLYIYGVPYAWQIDVACPQADGTMQQYRIDFLLPGNRWLEIQGAQMHKPSDEAAEQKRMSDILKAHPEWHRIPDLVSEEIAGGMLMGHEVQPALWKITDMLVREGLIKKSRMKQVKCSSTKSVDKSKEQE